MDRVAAYATLEISAEAGPGEIRAAYRRRAFATHPDRAGGDAAAFHAVSQAYRVLSDPALQGAPCHGAVPAEDASRAQAPAADARDLFDHLSDLASDMILNGATPEYVVAFLAGEGCPESVARALEGDLRQRARPAPAAADPEAAATAPPAVPSPRQPRRSVPRWAVAAFAALPACTLVGWLLAHRAGPPVAWLRHEAPPAAATVAATSPAAPAPTSDITPAKPGPSTAPPARGAPARSSGRLAPRRSVREDAASRAAPGTDLAGERDALEADQRRFAAEVAELDAERARIDAEETALAPASDVERFGALAPRKAAYNARLEAARRTERALDRRVRELNARITAHNEALRARP